MRRLLAVSLTLAAPLTARAERPGAPACLTPFAEIDLREQVERAKAAIDAGDVAAHREALTAIEAGIPCLDGQLPSRLWAEFLVTEALIRYADEAPGWQAPLKLAMDLVPDLAIPPHLMRDYFPPADPPGMPIEVPKGQLVVLDGRIVTGFIPPLAGMHVAQTVLDGTWHSRLVRGEPFPSEWLGTTTPTPDPTPAPAPRPTRALSSWGSVGLTGGFGAWGQSARDDAQVVERSTSGTWLGASSHGVQGITRGGGLFWTVAGGAQDSAAAPDAARARRQVPLGSVFAGASLFDEPLSVWLGGGAATARLTQSGSEGLDETLLWVPQYLVGVSYRARDGLPLDLSAGGGWGPWGTHAQAHAGAALLDLGAMALRVGADGTFTQATLVDRNLPGQPAVGRASTWSGGLNLGVSWGVDR